MSDKVQVINHEDNLYLFGINLSNTNANARLLVATVGLFLCYCTYGIFHEWFFRQPGLQSCGGFFTMLLFIFVGLISYFEFLITSNIKFSGKWYIIFCIGACSGLSGHFANEALYYLNYPTQNIFKSSKILPVMFIGIFILKTSYKLLEYVSMVLLCLGLTLFTLQDATLHSEFNPRGVSLICVSLIFDSIYINLQELGVKKHKINSTELVILGNLFGSLIIFCMLVLNNELVSSFASFNQLPLHSYGVTGLAATASYFGIKFVYFMIKSHGALVTVTLTTLRKALTITLSFVLFAKPFSLGYLWSGLLVVVAIYLNSYAKCQHEWNLWFKDRLARLFKANKRQQDKAYFENTPNLV